MAIRAALIPLDDVLEQLDSDEYIAEDSGDDLEMDGYYSYDPAADSSEEGIYYYILENNYNSEIGFE